jgi:hypothetical protein
MINIKVTTEELSVLYATITRIAAVIDRIIADECYEAKQNLLLCLSLIMLYSLDLLPVYVFLFF